MTTSDIRGHSPGDARPYRGPFGESSDSATYQITVKGCLDNSWSEWFDGLVITPDQQRGETTISGPVPDQAALHGLLNKVRNLGLTLLWVVRQDPNADTRDL